MVAVSLYLPDVFRADWSLFISVLLPLSHILICAETSTASRTLDALIHEANVTPALSPLFDYRFQLFANSFKFKWRELVPYPLPSRGLPHRPCHGLV